MQIVRYLPNYNDVPCAVAIGNFDGLHLGHRSVIKVMVRSARPQGLVPSVLTFEPHPRRYFNPDAPNFRIANLREKLSAFRSVGVHTAFIPRFDAPFAHMLAEEFMSKVLRNQINAKIVVTGENFVFGHKRRGTVAMLKSWGLAHNIKIVTVKPVMVGDVVCSSTAVRAALAEGKMDMVTQLVGRNYRLSGHVVQGDGRGRTLGFPTANMALPADLLLPAYGVYAARVMLDGKLYMGVVNIGTRPTVTVDNRPVLEVHVLDNEQTMYGKMLSVSLVHNIRPEIKFDSVEALKLQIGKDCETARALLGSANV